MEGTWTLVTSQLPAEEVVFDEHVAHVVAHRLETRFAQGNLPGGGQREGQVRQESETQRTVTT